MSRHARGRSDAPDPEGEDRPSMSLVAPLYNEEETVEEFYERAVSVLDSMDLDYEIVLVDDGSDDETFSLLEEISAADPSVAVVKFSRNFGHHIALTAGLDHARGEVVGMMDADLQDRPEELPKLYDKLQEGYDVVTGVRTERQDGLFKRATSWAYHRVMRWIFRRDFRGDNFRVFRRKVVDAVTRCRESERLVDGLVEWVGFDAARVEVEHAERHAGESKYSLGKQLRLAINSLTSFSTLPIQAVSTVGLVFSLFSFVGIIYLFVRKLAFGLGLPGWSSLMVTIVFMGGVQLLCLGILGEYIGRIAIDTRGRPLYVVDEHLSSDV